MSGGPWEKYQNKTSEDSGPWEKYQKTSSDIPAQAEQNPIGSAVRNFVQGGSLGLSDEFAGGVEAAGRAVGLDGLGGPFENISLDKEGPTLSPSKIAEAYKKGRDLERSQLQKDREQNPGTSATADFIGALVSPANKVAEGMSALKGGALLGGTTAFGMSNNNLTDNPVGLLEDTVAGSALGAGAGKLAEKASPYIEAGAQKVSDKAKSIAQSMAAKALGAERGTIKKFGADAVKDVGQYALDNGVLDGALSNTETKIENNQSAKNIAMAARKAVYDKIDEAGASEFNPVDVAKKVQEKILGDKNPNYEDTKELVAALQPHLDNIISRGENNISMDEAQKLVENLGKKAKFDTSRSNTQNDIAKQVYGIVRDEINSSADQAAAKLGDTGTKTALEQANQTFAKGKIADKLLENKNAREQGNKMFGLTDSIVGAGSLGYGAYTHDWKGAVGLVALKKFADKYGAQLAAKGFNALANRLAENPEVLNLYKQNPQAVQGWLNDYLSSRSGPKAAEAAGKIAGIDNQAPKADAAKQDRFASAGLDKVMQEKPEMQSYKDSLASNPKAQELLRVVSSLKPGTKMFDNTVSKLQALIEKGS